MSQDIRRSLAGNRFWLSLVVSLLILLRPLTGAFAGNMEGSFFQILSVPFATSDFTLFAAAFCVFPFSDSFCEDCNSGFVRSIVSRTGSRKYALGRCLSVMVTGGIMMASVILMTALICALLSNQMETDDTIAFMSQTIWAKMDLLLFCHGRIVVGIKVFLGFLFGSLWALVGLAVSTVWVNRYITVVTPFVIYQALWFGLEGKSWNPVYLLRGDSNYLPSLGYIMLIQGIWILIAFLFCLRGIRKKVEQS